MLSKNLEGYEMVTPSVIFFIGNLQKGGAERVLLSCATGLSKFFKVKILLGENKIDFPVLDDLEIDNLNFIRRNKIMSFALGFLKLRAFKKRNSPGITISFLNGANLLNVLTNWGLTTKSIISIRSMPSVEINEKRYKFLFKLSLRLTYKLADQIIVPTKEIFDLLEQDFKISHEKINLIYNPIDILNLRDMASQRNFEIAANRPIIANMGRFIYPKMQKKLIDLIVWRKKNNLSPITLVFIGDGKLFKEVIEYAKGLSLKIIVNSKGSSLNPDIIFTGQQNNPFAILEQAQIYFHSSIREGFPNAVIEAMALSIPTVCTDFHSGSRELLSDLKIEASLNKLMKLERGVLVPMMDNKCDGSDKYIELWSQAIDVMINDKSYSTSCVQNACSFVELKCNLSSIIESWRVMIQKCHEQA